MFTVKTVELIVITTIVLLNLISKARFFRYSKILTLKTHTGSFLKKVFF